MDKYLYDIFQNNWIKPNGSIFIYSDPHFSDLDCYKLRFPKKFGLDKPDPFCLRMTSVDINPSYTQKLISELDQMQIDNINKVCGKNDTLVILGDVGNIECVKKLKAGYKVLILGNHDKGASNYRKIEKFECPNCHSKNLNFINFRPDRFKCLDCNNFYNTADVYYTNKLFDEVYEGTLQISPKIILSHEPVDFKYCLNIHGHTHNITEPFYKEDAFFGDSTTGEECNFSYYHYCVIGEVNDYKPTNLNKIIKSGLTSSVLNIHQTTIDRAKQKVNHD